VTRNCNRLRSFECYQQAVRKIRGWTRVIPDKPVAVAEEPDAGCRFFEGRRYAPGCLAIGGIRIRRCGGNNGERSEGGALSVRRTIYGYVDRRICEYVPGW